MARVTPADTYPWKMRELTLDESGLPIPNAPPPPPPAPALPAKPKSQTAKQPRLEPAPEEPEFTPTPSPPPDPIEPEVSVLRQPRGGVAVNGTRLDHLLIEAQVINNSYFQADTFRLTMAISEEDQHDVAFWDQDEMEVEVFAGFGVDEPPGTSLVVGRTDDVEFDLEGRKVIVSGRDYTADLIDTKTTEKFVNKTASQIAEDIAGRHNLTAVVTPTRTLAGHYYQLEHARLNDDTTEWNLLTYLAEQEGYDVYVMGRELHFEPKSTRASAQRWILRYTQPSGDAMFPTMPVVKLLMRRSLTIARDIVVKVVSHNTKRKKNFTIERRTFRRTKNSGAKGSSREPVTHVYRLPGLTEEQAIKEAERRLQDLSVQERTVMVELPGDPRITSRTILVLEGTGTSFDQEYHVDEIIRTMSQRGGFTMSVTARNTPEESQAAL